MKRITFFLALMMAAVFCAPTAQAAPKDELSDAKFQLEMYISMASMASMVMNYLEQAELQQVLHDAQDVQSDPDATLDAVNAQITNLETLMAPHGPDMLIYIQAIASPLLNDLIVNEDDEEQQKIVDDAKAKVNALEWDSSKSCYENYMNLYSITTDAEAAIKAIAKYFYQVYDKTARTLTYYYDNHYDESNPNHQIMTTWSANGTNIKTVIIDASMKEMKVTSTAMMLYQYTDIESVIGLGNLNTENVTYMYKMFYGCKSLKSLDLSGFDTKNVTNMYDMFSGCESLETIDLSGFDTKNVTDMSQMFEGCESLETIDLSGFNVEKVTDITRMFYDCKELTTIYCETDMSGVADSYDMFSGCVKLEGRKGTKYDADHTSGEYALLDGKDGKPGYFSLPAEPVVYTVFDGTDKLTYYYNGKYDASNPNHVLYVPSYVSAGRWADYHNEIKTVVIDESMQTAPLTSFSMMFYSKNSSDHLDLPNMTTITGLDNLNTTDVTDMTYMFYGCKGLKSLNLSGFNTAKVLYMSQMFSSCESLESIDISDFNTWNVTSMSRMFMNCKSLKSLDLSHFNTAHLSYTSEMFSGCSQLTAIYCDKDWATAMIMSSSDMFAGCEALKGGKGTEWTATNPNDITYAHLDGESGPGYFTKKTTTAIDETPSPSGEGWGEASKILRDGQLLILRDGKTYTLTGQEVR